MREPETRDWLVLKANAYYRPRAQGYTRAVSEAGRYTKAEAELHAAVEPWHMKALHVSEAKPIGYEAGLVDQIASLREALTEALDGWEDAANYKLDYLREKHGDVEDIARLRALLPPTLPAEGCDSAAAARPSSETTHG